MRETHLADFVQEDRAAIGHFEQAALVLVRPGKRAFHVSEQFAFKQSLGKRSAVDGNKRICRSRRTNMHGAGNQFFAGAALAVNQDRALGGGNGTDGLLQLLDRRTGAYDVVQRVARGGITLESKVLAAERDFFERLGGWPSLISSTIARRLANIVGRASGLDRLHRGFVIVHGGDQDDR